MSIVIITLIIAAIMVATELALPGRECCKVIGWWARAIALNGLQIASVLLAGIAWDKWMLGKSLWHAESVLGVMGGAVIGYLVITFIYYWWHRMRHEVKFLWRWFHQVHHSPQRIEIITSFYKHPFEMLTNSILSSATLYMLVGLGPEAAAIAVLMTGIAELFYHWNVKTPYWLGFIFQRPESHCVHHQNGWHQNNFSDLPLWDMLFGTFHNPKRFDKSCGFSHGREKELSKMLVGIDVNRVEP